MKKKVKKVNKKEKTNKKIFNKNIIRTSCIVGILTVLIVLTVIIINYINNWKIEKKYGIYSDLIDRLGLGVLYNNNSTKSSDDVTNIEKAKLIMAGLHNKIVLDDMYHVSDELVYKYSSYTDELWVHFSEMFNIVSEGEIVKDNIYDETSRVQAIISIAKGIEKVLNKELNFEGELQFENKDEYTTEEQKYLMAAVNLGFIENSDKKLKSNETLIKGELNKILVITMEKFGIMQYNSEETGAKLVTDEDLLPKNADEYPYIIDTIDKEVYEYDFKVNDAVLAGVANFENPKLSYTTKYGKAFYATDDKIKKYFDTILNVDYETITLDSFKESLESTLAYKIRVYDEDIDEYISYVKDNKIKLNGNITTYFPILYYTGSTYVIRAKIEFQVLSSDTNTDLLFGDLSSYNTVKYNSENNKYFFYIDLPLSILPNTYTFRLDNICIANNIISDDSSITVE